MADCSPRSCSASRSSFLVPVLSATQEAVLRLLALGWCAAAVWFWLWWLAAARGPWTLGRGAASALLSWVFFLGAYFLFFACRMSRPNPLIGPPRCRVAMVVTKAPSEPWPVVQRTLEAMLSQEYGQYDVWLADEDPSDESLSWCREAGVQVSTRRGVDGYHRPDWPRRARCKEGNLAFFYDRFGYERYEIVAQLDADHVPAPTYLREMVRPFADPRVGYVAAPSICDANERIGWTVKGRLLREASMHGPIQAGCNGGWAPVCIGSHYAVRTTALRSVGGLGPELAEDYTTTLWLQSAGWDGVFAIDAEAHGDGPETVNDMLTQELQWSRSLGAILVRWAPGRLRNAPLRARARLTFALAFYLMQSVMFSVAALLTPVALLTRVSWGNASLASFYLHLWLCSILLFITVRYLRRCRVLRPEAAKTFSFALVLFQLVRWPVVAWGFVQGMWHGWRRRGSPPRVTPKGTRTAEPLRLSFVLPLFGLGLLPLAAAAAAPHTSGTIGFLSIAIIQGLVYTVAGVAVVALHIHATRRKGQNGQISASEINLTEPVPKVELPNLTDHRVVDVGVPPSSAPSTSVTPTTEVRFVAPVDPQGRPLPDITASTGGSGCCRPGSHAIGNADVYRGCAGNYDYDPCWADTGGKASGLTVLCQQDPWSTLFGYPGVAALDPSGHQVEQAARQPRGYLGGIPSGQSPPTVTLEPGATAPALVERSPG